MGRTKKITSLPRAKPARIQEEEKTVPTVRETHHVNRTWVEERSIDEIEAGESEDFSIDPDLEPPDPIQAIIDEISLKHANWAMHVYRLPNYDKDQRTDPKSRKFCGTLSIPDGDYLLQDTYLQDIQEKFARPGEINTFLIIIRKNNLMFREFPIVTVEPPPPDVLAKMAPAPGMNGVTILNQHPSQDPIKDLVRQVKQLSEIRDALLPPELLKQITLPQQQAQANPVTDETAMFHLLNRDGEIIDNLVGKFKDAVRRRDGQHEPTFMDLALAAINNNTLPKMMDKAMEMLGSILNARNGAQVANGMAGSPAPVPPGAAPAPVPTDPAVNPAASPNGQPATTMTSMTPEIALLNFAIHQCAYNSEAGAVAEWIITYEEQYPAVSPYVNMFVAMPPADALEWLSKSVPDAAHIAQMAHALTWIEGVQNEIKSRSVEGDDQKS